MGKEALPSSNQPFNPADRPYGRQAHNIVHGILALRHGEAVKPSIIQTIRDLILRRVYSEEIE